MNEIARCPLPCPFCGKPPEVTHMPVELYNGCIPTRERASWMIRCASLSCCGPSAHSETGEADAIEKWNRRPNPETQAVAQLEVRNGVAGLKHLLAPIDQVSDGMMLYRSPVGAVPISALEKLVEELRADNVDRPCYCAHCTNMRHSCADRLSAVIRGTKT